MSVLDYRSFLDSKALAAHAVGLDAEADDLSGSLFDFQRDVTSFCLRQGRAGLFLDTGLGKTICELEFAARALESAGGSALILTPLAVARQIEREAHRFDYDARVIREQSDARQGINICNYDRLDKLDPDAFGVIVLDESSVLKSFTGKTTRALIEMFSGHRFRLAATATPAPNDHMELGQHAEFLGVMAANEMLSRFFINDTSTASQHWRLKGHAESTFWDWMASWSRMAQSPDDLGYDDSAFVLPELKVVRHQTCGDVRPAAGSLFAADMSATNMFDVKRQTCAARAKLAAEIVFGDWGCGSQNMQKTRHTASSANSGPKISPGGTRATQGQAAPRSVRHYPWSNTEPCSIGKAVAALSAGQTSQEGTAISASITVTQPDKSAGYSVRTAITESESSETIQSASGEPLNTSAQQPLNAWILWCDTNDEQDALEREFGDFAISIRGSQPAEEKEALITAWLEGARPALITKGSIFGYGMNFQHCARMAFVGRSFSYEAWYQAVRRCWRFGQKRPVEAHVIVAEGEDQIGRVIDRKSEDHQRMKLAMAGAMRRAMGRSAVVKAAYEPHHMGRLPRWIA